ncbi:MAG: tyrosine-protein phosphatase, partial [Clostridia bacterium]|nr:tyrosine-protein phosphatase [Clostridia bacterium]
MSWKPSHVDNFRELCGFDAADGKKVKSGMIFRSGSLFNIKVKTLDRIHDKKGVSAVVDFRSDSETAEKPDTQTQSVGYYHIPPLTDEQNPSINRHNRLTVLNRICEKDGGGGSAGDAARVGAACDDGDSGGAGRQRVPERLRHRGRGQCA